MWLLEMNPIIPAFAIVMIAVILIWLTRGNYDWEIDPAYTHWRKVDAVDAILDCADRMAQDLQDYADKSEDVKTDFANPTLNLLDEYDALKLKLAEVCCGG